jgi:hypothetical protein
MTTRELKLTLIEKCTDYIDQQINNIQEALTEAKESGNDETKSSAGDKHETGRAQMHLEQEKNAKQLQEAINLKRLLSKINPNDRSGKVVQGSIVKTDKGNFFISISAGKFIVDSIDYFAISPLSPIAQILKTAKVKQEIEFNGKKYMVKEIL